MKDFIIYLKEKKKIIIGWVICSFIFLASFLFYHIEVRAAIYPSVLSLLVLIGLGIWDFVHRAPRLEYLRKLADSEVEIVSSLPDAKNLTEEKYQEIIWNLKAAMEELEQNQHLKYNDMVDYYTAWAHQIKTPIAAMKLNLQSEDTAFSRKLQRELFRVEQYVEMIMTFLRLEGDGSDYVFRECDLTKVTREAIRKFAGEFISRKLSPDIRMEEGTFVLTDAKWASFVIEQILSNALKYTKEGKVSVYMAGPKVLCLEDTGIGIAESDLPRIFEKSFTGYNGRADLKASGIGLYLCKKICDRLNHNIWAESKPGVGTRVYIDFNSYEFRAE